MCLLWFCCSAAAQLLLMTRGLLWARYTWAALGYSWATPGYSWAALDYSWAALGYSWLLWATPGLLWPTPGLLWPRATKDGPTDAQKSV